MKPLQTTLATALLILIFGFVRQGISQELASAEKVYSPPLVKTLESGETEIELQQVLPAPTTGTFLPISGSFPPMPMAPNPELGLPIYFWNEGVFLFDDEGLDTKILREAGIPLFNTGHSVTKAKGGALLAMSDGPPAPGEGEGGEEPEQDPLPLPFSYTNGLWLDIYSYDSNWLTLELHGTVENGFYEILTKTNLSEPAWAIDHGVIGFDGLTLANAISVVGKSNFFFWARNSGQDEDGDGLPDWWETENGLDATLSDTGNTGTSDGYKDTDNDGWTNLEEFQNGTSPSGFNTPPAPRGLTVSLNSSGTVANLSWNPSGGAVTGYAIERVYYETGLDTFSAVASAQTFTDTSAPVHSYPGYYAPTYRIRANYVAGNSAWSPYVSVHPPATSSFFWMVRGPGGLAYLVSSALSPDVVAVKLTRIDYSDEEPATYESTISLTNFVDGMALLTEQHVPMGSADIYWAQTVGADGSLGEFNVIGSFWESIPFFDGREQLKQNLSFVLRAADAVSPFDFILSESPNWVIRWGTENYAYASFYEAFDYEDSFSAAPHEFRPFRDNYIYRNFVFDDAHLNSSGRLTNGISKHSPSDLPLLTQADAPYLFEQPTSPTSIPTILSSNITERIYHQSNQDRIGLDIDFLGFTHTLSSDSKNMFGLDYLSVRTAYGSSNGVEFINIYPGQTVEAFGSYFYPEIEQPILRTVDYYFAREDADPFPGSVYFDPTNTTPLFLISGNHPNFDFIHSSGQFRLAAYAKQSIDNGDTNKFAYLGLYFDKAYKVDLNGNITTNETGILSEYGEFFPTEPGRAILTTKPESIGETNIGGVLVHTIKLELDVNHDGTIDRSITGPDNTSYQKPFVFWVNNDNDGKDYGNGIEINAETFPDSRDTEITSTRDLEDFARLWISGVPSLPSSEGYAVTLSWQGNSGPTIRIYDAFESDGGIAYLTNATTANNTVSGSSRFARTNLSSSGSYPFPANYFNGTRKHFIFEGVTAGEGELLLTITKNSQPIATTSVYISIKDIKDLYEQVFAENISSNFPPSTLTSEFTTIRRLAGNSSEAKQTIVFVHGINNTEWEYRNTSETMFKRLYWSGYQGRLASFRWPSPLLPDCAPNPIVRGSPYDYNKGEYIAFKSANALKDYLHSLTNRLPDYTINVLAHSMGGIVTSEALRLGAPFNNCILSQAAVPAHSYDVNAPFLQKFLTAEQDKPTPLQAADGGYHGYFTNLTGNIINFYNTNDYALVSGVCVVKANWERNHETQKPESFSWNLTDYGFNTNTLECFTRTDVGTDIIINTVTDPYEKKAMVARTRSAAVGGQGGVAGVINTNDFVNLRTQFGFSGTREEHSAQFTRSIQTVGGYYQAIRIEIEPE